ARERRITSRAQQLEMDQASAKPAIDAACKLEHVLRRGLAVQMQHGVGQRVDHEPARAKRTILQVMAGTRAPLLRTNPMDLQLDDVRPLAANEQMTMLRRPHESQLRHASFLARRADHRIASHALRSFDDSATAIEATTLKRPVQIHFPLSHVARHSSPAESSRESRIPFAVAPTTFQTWRRRRVETVEAQVLRPPFQLRNANTVPPERTSPTTATHSRGTPRFGGRRPNP